MRRLIALFALALSGCTTAGTSYLHASHPLAGWPVGPAWEEDTIDAAEIWGRRELGYGVFVESSVAYKLRDGGMRGPRLLYLGRVGVVLYDRRR